MAVNCNERGADCVEKTAKYSKEEKRRNFMIDYFLLIIFLYLYFLYFLDEQQGGQRDNESSKPLLDEYKKTGE